ncbi:hypothetical protein NTE_02692 [Candidatus Nitrososphaera evergladensis SR1]|jgi:hypothetical protein|uniref:Uncharacterized protein n=1 Tax=Candidatus Nitrososphaera evergladensis SR1 TaxID=1459636 RepID=A0A075MZS8_9ARCH|nr:hypothetical protein NTE_02692 [Candidatus Nitrososphaera evergladensis SR1]
MSIKCAECQCDPQDCMKVEHAQRCGTCTKEACCCIAIHNSAKKYASKLTLTKMNDDCCASGVCKNDSIPQKTTSQSGLLQFLRNAKALYAAALGIEILCIVATEIGENTGLYLFGFNQIGIPIAYAMGYALAGFTTFATILGRYNYGSNDRIDGCCSVLEQGAGTGFTSNLKTTFKNLAIGMTKLPQLHRQPNKKYMLKTSAYILVTAESACILTAETIDLVFYQYSLLLSIPLALLAGAFTVVAPEAYRKTKRKAN